VGTVPGCFRPQLPAWQTDRAYLDHPKGRESYLNDRTARRQIIGLSVNIKIKPQSLRFLGKTSEAVVVKTTSMMGSTCPTMENPRGRGRDRDRQMRRCCVANGRHPGVPDPLASINTKKSSVTRRDKTLKAVPQVAIVPKQEINIRCVSRDPGETGGLE